MARAIEDLPVYFSSSPPAQLPFFIVIKAPCVNYEHHVVLLEQIDHLKVSADTALPLDQDFLILKALGKRCSSMIHHEFGFFTVNPVL
jgi:hypothetical protein